MPLQHGQSGKLETAEYRAWRKMKARCKSTTGKGWRAYAGRGIRVCARWLNSFENFFEDMGMKPSPFHTLDRLDNDKGYDADNCQWATRYVQDRNKRSTVWVKFNGKSYCQKDFGAIFGVTDATIIHKFKKGWSVDDVVAFYEAKHNKTYKNVSSWQDALTALAYAYHKSGYTFFRVGQLEGLGVPK